ncbi:MAG: D-Ala-D-Ala carboxypeptidase family metallohydrolase, partial [Eubacterium sp.]
ATIEILRESLGAPVIITSGVRCTRYNAEVGGIEYSRHLRGHAADLYSPQIDIHTVAQVASTLGLTVITYYDQGFIHVENEK